MKQTIQAEIPPPLSANSLAFGLSRSSPCCFGPLSAVRADDITLPNTVAFVGAALIDGTGNALQLRAIKLWLPFPARSPPDPPVREPRSLRRGLLAHKILVDPAWYARASYAQH
jgi:hypothetical protein